MPLVDKVKALLDRKGLRSGLVPVVSYLAKSRGRGVRRIFYDHGIWIHETSGGYFAYHQPFVRLNMSRMDELAKENFLWGYTPKVGDIVIDVGAGAGEEALTFSRAVGKHGKVICIEAHPRTYRCLEKLVQYNRLENVVAIHQAVADPGCRTVTIEDSDDYLGNRSGVVAGLSVPAATLDAIYLQLGLSNVHFLKMNIEGAERVAIQGMAETLRNTEALCVSCHDFLARASGDDCLRTRDTVQRFLQEKGFKIVTREDPGLAPYVRDQVWAYREHGVKKMANSIP
jgi:FkbM family methyltransferase